MKKTHLYAALLLSVLGVLLLNKKNIRGKEQEVSANSSITSPSPLREKRSSKSKSVLRIERVFEKSQSKEQLLALLQENLLANETETVLAWSTFSTHHLEEDLYSFNILFIKHFLQRYSALEALKIFEPVQASKEKHFRAVVTGLLHDYNENDHPQDLLHFLNNPQQKDIAEIVAESIGYRFGSDGPETALGLVEQIEDESMKQRVLEAVLNKWASEDLESVGAHLNALPFDKKYDQVISNVIDLISPGEPALNMTWAESIVDDELREEKILLTAQTWLSDDSKLESYYIWKDKVVNLNLLKKLDQQETAGNE